MMKPFFALCDSQRAAVLQRSDTVSVGRGEVIVKCFTGRREEKLLSSIHGGSKYMPLNEPRVYAVASAPSVLQLPGSEIFHLSPCTPRLSERARQLPGVTVYN
ncbi:hypothetical protein JOB18_020947 [Solea senegalensis]|uniref:Uncharacterized protein n=1 Tax=Solea senegalensis TaxID=28829 RepID=A0AAV6PWW2_SOLSE|nr:hypothetical protein JOB18_020947 [Solea senegalensis]